jgi:hypothetical protein
MLPLRVCSKSCFSAVTSRYWSSAAVRVLSHRFPAAGLVEETEDAALVNGVDGRIHVGVASQHDAVVSGDSALILLNKLNAVHTGHSHVGNHDRIGTELGREFQGLLRHPGQFPSETRGPSCADSRQGCCIVVH